MEPDQLQLVFNVIAITGITSLASFCYLLRKENRMLSTERTSLGPEGPDHAPEIRRFIENSLAEQPSAQCAVPATKAGTAGQDIRHLAADRRTGWVKGLTSAISYDGCC